MRLPGRSPLFLAACAALVLNILAVRAQEGQSPHLDPARPVSERVDHLVGRMTLEEKVSQLMNGAAAIPRLGVPEYDWWNEALHGVARAGLATVFPQAIGLAAAFDEPLMFEVATTISDEARAKYNLASSRGARGLYQGLTFWSPNINIFRDPRWGRGMETYGEDPYLAGRLAVAFVKGMQGNDARYLKTVATPKHYAVHSGPEPERHTFDVAPDAEDLRSTYLPQFEMAVREGGALSVMCAYNRVDGEAACASPRLLSDILRRSWGFSGYVVSDCGAIDDIYRTHKLVATAEEASAMAIKAGCDLECGGSYRSLVEAVRQGRASEADIDVAVKRLFAIRFRLGMFDPPERLPWASFGAAQLDTPANRALALRTARESIVLLKNDGAVLPLRKGLKRVAVIGPNAADVEVLLGNYKGMPAEPVTVLDGIRRTVEANGGQVLYARGSDVAENMPFLEVVPNAALSVVKDGQRRPGLEGEYFEFRDGEGKRSLEYPDLSSRTPAFTRVDANVDFNWWEGSPDPRLADVDNFAVRWTGEIEAPATGTYHLGALGASGFRLSVDGKEIARSRSSHDPVSGHAAVELQAGRRYPVRLEYFHRARTAVVRLLWRPPAGNLLAEAVAAAKQAEAVVLVLGLSPRLEGEEMRVPVAGFAGGDRVDIGLPAVQERLMREVAALGKPTVLVLLNGSALAATWADEHLPAIVEAWYPGQAAGTAVADVLFGDYNPGGRLPVTFYRSVSDLPPFADYRMAGRTYRYFKGRPLYPFGHGLSYSRFEYKAFAAGPSKESRGGLLVGADVTNTGAIAGDEVVQLYVSAAGTGPTRSLQGFRRMTLAPGETRRVWFELTARQLAALVPPGAAQPGEIEVSIGGKQPGFTGTADAATTGVVTARVSR